MATAKQNKGGPLPSSRDGVYTPQETRMLDQITIEVTEAWAKDLTTMKKAFKKNEDLSVLLNEMYHQVKARLGMIESFFDEEGKFKSFDEILQNQKVIGEAIYKQELEIDKLKTATSKFCLLIADETKEIKKTTTEVKEKFDQFKERFDQFMASSLEINKKQIQIQQKELECQQKLVELEKQRKWWKFW